MKKITKRIVCNVKNDGVNPIEITLLPCFEDVNLITPYVDNCTLIGFATRSCYPFLRSDDDLQNKLGVYGCFFFYH